MAHIETIEDLLAASDIEEAAAVIKLASAARGSDVARAVACQAERREDAAHALLNRAGISVEPSELLADEARKYGRLKREAAELYQLATRIEDRSQYRPPASVATPDTTERTEAPAVLQRGQSMRDWHRRRSGAVDVGPAPRPGAVIRAHALGDRRGLHQSELRALAEGAGPSGGFLVGESLLSGFVDRVRNASVCFRAGAVVVPMRSAVVNIARIGQPDSVSPSIPQPQWKSENALIEEGGLVLERAQLVAKTLPVICVLSVELAEDAEAIDEAIERELSQAIAGEIDRAALLGSGIDPEPRGVRNTSGVTVSSFGGSTPANHDFAVDLAAELWRRNHTPSAFICNADLTTVSAKLKAADYQPLQRPAEIASIGRLSTNSIPNDAVSPNTSTMFVGDWQRLAIGVRTEMTLEASRVSGDAFGRLQIQIRAYWRGDVAVLDPAAFAIRTDVGIG